MVRKEKKKKKKKKMKRKFCIPTNAFLDFVHFRIHFRLGDIFVSFLLILVGHQEINMLRRYGYEIQGKKYRRFKKKGQECMLCYVVKIRNSAIVCRDIAVTLQALRIQTKRKRKLLNL